MFYEEYEDLCIDAASVNIIEELQNELSRKAMKEKDDLLRYVFDRFFKDGWCLNDIKERGECAILPDKTEVYSIDKKPLIEFYPYRVEFSSNNCSISQKYKILI